MKVQFAMAAVLVALASPSAAAADRFTQGPVITGFGAVAKVDVDVPVRTDVDYKIAFDLKSGTAGTKSNGLDSVARLMNMLASSGVPASRIKPAIVIHNNALWDLTSDARYAQHYGTGPNPSADLVRQLIAKGVPIYVCGQTLAWNDVPKSDLLPGVKVTLSAMSAHAMLHREGYSVNPF